MADSVHPVALERMRTAARERIGDGYAGDLIDADELDRRLEALERAATAAEVETLVVDLGAPLVHAAHTPVTSLVVRDDVPEQQRIRAIFSETKRVGRWIAARENQIVAVFASLRLDLRETQLGAGTTVFHVKVAFAELEVIVPPGLHVVVDCDVVFGEVDHDDSLAHGDMPTVRVRIDGSVWFGSVSVRERFVGESKWDARKRRKAERKRLAESRKTKALGPAR